MVYDIKQVRQDELLISTALISRIYEKNEENIITIHFIKFLWSQEAQVARGVIRKNWHLWCCKLLLLKMIGKRGVLIAEVIPQSLPCLITYLFIKEMW